MYRVGIPGWKLAAKLGVPVRLRVFITQDLEANVYVAESPDLAGLVIEAHTLDEVKSEALACAKTLLRQGSTAHQIWSNGMKSVTVSTNCYSRHTANAILQKKHVRIRIVVHDKCIAVINNHRTMARGAHQAPGRSACS